MEEASRRWPRSGDDGMGAPVMSHAPLAVATLISAGGAALILVVFLARRADVSTPVTKLWLFVGLGVLPIAAAATGNIEGFEATKRRAFCGSCHVMTPYTEDSGDRSSGSLASRHGRNELFGKENCYSCHADYEMYGTITTKLGGMRHVYEYYTDYRTVPLAQALPRLHLYKPYPNRSCMQCHSTELELWGRVPDHRSSLDDVRAGRISCASGGCHGFAHPFSKSIAAGGTRPVTESP
jgi:hypothetical protein